MRYVIAGSVAAKLQGLDVTPGDLDVVPALDRENLQRLADLLREIEAVPERTGRWETTGTGERRWLAEAAEVPADWKLDPDDLLSLDHAFSTNLGNFDVVPSLMGSYDDLKARAILSHVHGGRHWLAAIEDLLAGMTKARRDKDVPRVKALRALQRESAGWQELAVDAAREVLERAWRHPVSIRPHQVIRDWGRHRLLSCVVKRGPEGAPNQVVVKVSQRACGTIFAEWAGLELLNRLDQTRAIVPRLYGGDRERDLLVIEHVGEGPTLHHLLQSRRSWAVNALEESMWLLAQVHGATQGLCGEYAELYAKLTHEPIPPTELDRTLACLADSLSEACDAIGVDSRAAASELELIATRLLAEDCACYTFDDQCPPNRVLTNERLRFVDLEMGRFRHPFIDAAYPIIGHLRCMDGLRLPTGVRETMLDAYRGALATHAPALVMDQRFDMDMACASAARLVQLLGALPRALELDRTVGYFGVRSRERIVASLEAFLDYRPVATVLPELTLGKHPLEGTWSW